MKLAKKIVLLLLVLFLLLTPICSATSNQVATNNNTNVTSDKAVTTGNNTTDNPVVTGTNTEGSSDGATKILNTDFYGFEQDLVISDSVNGNVFAFGTNVTVSGEIVGDLFVFADTLKIEDTAVIYSNIFAFANNITFAGNAYDIYAFATKNFNLTASGYVYRDIRVCADDISINGIVRKDAYIYANNITIPENATNLIGGNLNYSSENEASIPQASVIGSVNFTQVNKTTTRTVGEIILSYVKSFITSMAYAIIVILLAVFLAPKFADKANYALMKKPYISAGIGILAAVLIPFVSILFIVTGFLTYVAFAMLAVYVLVFSITIPIFALAISKYIMNKMNSDSKLKFILFAILSAVVLWLLRLIPYIGGFISLFIYVVELGVFLFAIFSKKTTDN